MSDLVEKSLDTKEPPKTHAVDRGRLFGLRLAICPADAFCAGTGSADSLGLHHLVRRTHYRQVFFDVL